jgi:pimeloyl-ACP methyl ester carboxylesterase
MTDWLLLRGLVREQAHWGAFPRLFEDANPGAKVELLDLPGTGTEHARPAPGNVVETVLDVRRRFLALRGDRPRPVGVLGISFGGMVALEWAARYPDDFQRLVVINTSAGNMNPPWERLRAANYGRILRAAATQDLRVRERAVVELTINRRDFDQEALVDSWVAIGRARPVSRRTLLHQLLAASRSVLPRSIKPPLLVLTSRADRLVSATCSERIAARLGAKLAIHGDAGHDLPFDAPEWLIDRIAREG